MASNGVGDRPRSSTQRNGELDDPGATLELWDYRRSVVDLYARVRVMDPEDGWAYWVSARDELFRTHSQSPLPVQRRNSFSGLSYWPYDPRLRVAATVEPVPSTEILLTHSGDGVTPGRSFGRACFRLESAELSLVMYWLSDYGGGVFIPFADTTNGRETYGGGRYLLDSAKGADLGHDRERVVLDFNFAYHPSCVHDARWSCPLPPSGNRLPIAIRGGERLPG
jgi:uncharacterized protein (DUF1684 family)